MQNFSTIAEFAIDPDGIYLLPFDIAAESELRVFDGDVASPIPFTASRVGAGWQVTATATVGPVIIARVPSIEFVITKFGSAAIAEINRWASRFSALFDWFTYQLQWMVGEVDTLSGALDTERQERIAGDAAITSETDGKLAKTVRVPVDIPVTAVGAPDTLLVWRGDRVEMMRIPDFVALFRDRPRAPLYVAPPPVVLACEEAPLYDPDNIMEPKTYGE